MSGSSNKDSYGLTTRQRRFADAYLLSNNKRASAMAIGVSANSAGTTAARMCANVHIKNYLAMRRQDVSKQLDNAYEITKDRILREIAAAALFDPGKMYNSDGEMLPLQQMDEITRRAIAAFDVQEVTDSDGTLVGYIKRIKPVSKMAALELAGRHLGMWNQKDGQEQSILNIVIDTDKNQLDNPPPPLFDNDLG